MAGAFKALSDAAAEIQHAHGLNSTEAAAVIAELLSVKLGAMIAARNGRASGV